MLDKLLAELTAENVVTLVRHLIAGNIRCVSSQELGISSESYVWIVETCDRLAEYRGLDLGTAYAHSQNCLNCIGHMPGCRYPTKSEVDGLIRAVLDLGLDLQEVDRRTGTKLAEGCIGRCVSTDTFVSIVQKMHKEKKNLEWMVLLQPRDDSRGCFL